MKVTRLADLFVQKFGYRLTREADLGIVHGVTLLRCLFSFLNIDMVFDVGANEGQYGKLLRTQVGYCGPIVSVEPIPEVAAQLGRLAGSDPRWKTLNCALDNAPGVAPFRIMKGSEFSSLLEPDAAFIGKFDGQQMIDRTINVRCEKLDTVVEAERMLNQFARPLLKIDTQGTELRVLQGAPATLREFVAVQLELSYRSIYTHGTHYAAAVGFMKENAFELSALFPNNRGHFPHLFDMDAIFVARDRLPPPK